ncbi:DNA-binding transcriptional regulator, MarR family [Amycolatopsis sacchari]|uniref:DNA-binding transcriptional regulator, MarR family n=1 Tax=Amycolatopsis sacchari TaxID=115433 RepID=A0A1I4BYV9_9PSEU|nr:DNA-binding transcriptional regulator, MarR family [Amycolatopsis sacchari]
MMAAMADVPPARRPSVKVSAKLARRLRASVGGFVRSARSADRMSPVMAGVLDLLHRHGPMTTADLAALRKVRHQTMSTTVADLVESGLVETGPHPDDRRKKLNSLTEAGREALARDAEQREAVLARAISESLSKEDVEALTNGLAVLERLTAALDERSGGTEGPFVTGDW